MASAARTCRASIPMACMHFQLHGRHWRTWPNVTRLRSPLKQRWESTASHNNSRSALSNSAAADVTLKAANVDLEIVDRKTPRDVEEVWTDLNNMLGSNVNDAVTSIGLDSARSALENPLTREFELEKEFNEALFGGLRQCLTPYELKNAKLENGILFNIGKTEEYAVGIVNHCETERNHSQRGIFKSLNTASDGLNAGGRTKNKASLDHAACLLQKDSKGEWNVKDVFSVVKLKMSDTTCQAFPTLNDQIYKCFLDHEQLPLGELLLYTMRYILPYHSRRGVLGDYLPLAIIAGRRMGLRAKLPMDVEKRDVFLQSSSRRLHWVSGRFNIPEEFGDSFSFCVNDFDEFYDESSDAYHSAMDGALSVYLDTILFGLKRAIDVQKSLSQNVLMPSKPASGRSLVIGNVQCKVQFLASHLAGTNTDQPVSKGDEWNISQGELFSGRLRISKALFAPEPRHICFFDQDGEYTHTGGNVTKAKEIDVVVKVSSLAVHSMLIHPDKSFGALEKIKRKKGLARKIGIGSVLFGIVHKNGGLVTVMADLFKQGYCTLKPRDHRDRIGMLRAGFEELVKNVLLPVAKFGIVHPDIRPGFDTTFNILCKLEDGRDIKATMKLIDFESLVHLYDWKAPQRDGRYITRRRNWDATTFVWWQCICLAYTWKNELDSNSLVDRNLFDGLVTDFYGPRKIAWLNELGVHTTSTMDADCVQHTLDKLAKLFAK